MDIEGFAKVVGSIAACAAALVAIVGIIKELCRLIKNLLRIKSAHLKGRWIGDRFGDEWDFEGELQLESKSVSGRICRTLKKCPTTVPWHTHVGKSGYE